MNLITGATGFVGGHVVEYLFQQNEISKAIFRMGSHLKILDLNGVQGIEADLLDHHSLHEGLEGCDTVYNLASPMPGADSDFARVNSEGISNLLGVAREVGVKTIVHLSTMDVYGFGAALVDASSPLTPSGDYQESKAQADRILLDGVREPGSPRAVVVRAARALGSRDDTLVAPVVRMIAQGKVVLPGGSVMSFTHPKDIAQAMYKAATTPSVSTGVYLVSSFDARPEDFVRTLSGALGRSPEIRREGLFAKSPLGQYTTRQLAASQRLAPQSSWASLGYSPEFDLGKTCSEIAQWCKKEPWVAEQS